MTLRVLSMLGPLLQTQADSVTVPALDGSLGILRGHAPMIAALGRGRVSYRLGDEAGTCPILGGVLEVKDDIITILTDGDGPEGNTDNSIPGGKKG